MVSLLSFGDVGHVFISTLKQGDVAQSTVFRLLMGVDVIGGLKTFLFCDFVGVVEIAWLSDTSKSSTIDVL